MTIAMMPKKANAVHTILLGLMPERVGARIDAKHMKTPIQSTLLEVNKGRFCGGLVSGDTGWTRGGS